MELVQQQKRVQAKQATGVSPQQLGTAISQVMSCLYVGNKKTPVDSNKKGGKQLCRDV